jgi:hypothetical protein
MRGKYFTVARKAHIEKTSLMAGLGSERRERDLPGLTHGCGPGTRVVAAGSSDAATARCRVWRYSFPASGTVRRDRTRRARREGMKRC